MHHGWARGSGRNVGGHYHALQQSGVGTTAEMAAHPACHTVEDYLAAMFPGSVIQEYEWKAERCWAFKVSISRHTFQLMVSTKFLNEAPDHEIERCLRGSYVASRMRQAGRAWILVTANGVTQGLPNSASPFDRR